MENAISKKRTHKIYLIGIILKGVNAALEIASGIFIFFVSHENLANFVLRVTQGELSEDPKDVIAHFLIRSANELSLSTQHFFSIYLIFHGTIKLVMVAGLLKDKIWAYPASLTLFSFFILFQLYRLSFAHSIWLLLLTTFDALVIYLIWREYRFHKQTKN